MPSSSINPSHRAVGRGGFQWKTCRRTLESCGCRRGIRCVWRDLQNRRGSRESGCALYRPRPCEKSGRSQSADASADDDQIVGFTRIDGLGRASQKSPLRTCAWSRTTRHGFRAGQSWRGINSRARPALRDRPRPPPTSRRGIAAAPTVRADAVQEIATRNFRAHSECLIAFVGHFGFHRFVRH